MSAIVGLTHDSSQREQARVTRAGNHLSLMRLLVGRSLWLGVLIYPFRVIVATTSIGGSSGIRYLTANSPFVSGRSITQKQLYISIKVEQTASVLWFLL